MKRLLIAWLAVPSVGCAYAGDRLRDFGDLWRVEFGVGAGIQADVTAGELAHVGVGSSRRWTAGFRYGEAVAEKRVEDHFPLSFVWTIVTPDTESLHSLRWGDATRSQHRCFWLLPGELKRGTYEKERIHYYDVEVSAFGVLVGVQLGFSLGQFVDWITGFFGADLGQDDGELRERPRYWQPIPQPWEPDAAPTR
ncbi:MAG: hypothetical protein HYY16_07685 [Planctomycetes bacterium]|nr:hypothetical protein [Planctomycetota bacterium]